MNKILVLLFVTLSFSAFAQIEKGTRSFGATGGGSLYRLNSNQSSLRLEMSPELGTFVHENLMLLSALNLGYYYSKSGSSKNRTFLVGLELSSRYYFLFSRRWMPYLQAGLGGVSNFHRTRFTSSLAINSQQFDALVFAQTGISCFLMEELALEAGLRYDYNFGNGLPSGILFSFPVGFKYFFW